MTAPDSPSASRVVSLLMQLNYFQELPAHPMSLPVHLCHHHHQPRQQQAQQQQQTEQQQQTTHQTQQAQQPSAGAECRQLCSIAVPLCIEGVAGIGTQMVGTVAVGRLPGGGAALAALVLAQAVYAVSGISLVSGLASALETLVGQAFGAGSWSLLPVLLVRAALICGVAIVPTLLWWSSGGVAQLLVLLGQDPGLAQPASRLLQVMTIALGTSVLTDSTAHYLLASSRPLPIMAASLLALAAAPGAYWLFVLRLGLGLQGAALAAVAVQGCLAAALLGYLFIAECWRRPPRDAGSWAGFSWRAALRGWPAYLAYGLPCVAMVCLEWWTWELLVVLAGLLPGPTLAVAVTGISTQLQTLPWLLSFSIGTATSTRIAQALGAGEHKRAARIFRLACLLVLLCSGMWCLGMWAGQDWLVAAFAEAADVQGGVKQVLPVIVAAIVFDGQAAVAAGALRGAGRQGVGATASIGGYWCVGMPLAYVLAFRVGWGVLGLRTALCLAVAVQALVLHGVVARMDWRGAAMCARKQLGLDSERAVEQHAAGAGVNGDLQQPLLAPSGV